MTKEDFITMLFVRLIKTTIVVNFSELVTDYLNFFLGKLVHLRWTFVNVVLENDSLISISRKLYFRFDKCQYECRTSAENDKRSAISWHLDILEWLTTFDMYIVTNVLSPILSPLVSTMSSLLIRLLINQEIVLNKFLNRQVFKASYIVSWSILIYLYFDKYDKYHINECDKLVFKLIVDTSFSSTIGQTFTDMNIVDPGNISNRIWRWLNKFITRCVSIEFPF